MAAGLGGRAERRRRAARRRRVVAGVSGLLGVGLVVGAAAAALGGGDGKATRATEEPRATSTTSTTVPVPTTAVPESTNPVVALAQQYDGFYEGTFTNTTFGTEGKATVELRIDPAAATFRVAADFDGDVFGGGAEKVREIGVTVAIGDPNSSLSEETEEFGTVVGRIDPSLALVLSAPDVPDPNVATFELTGRLRDDRTGFDATYHVVFEDGSTADGVVTVACSTRKQRPSVVPTLCTPPA